MSEEEKVEPRMTVADGLAELKLINQKIMRKTGEITQYASKRKGTPDKVDKQRSHVASLLQACNSLVQRYVNIKYAIQKSNLETGFWHNGERYTVAQGLFLKQGLFDIVESIYSSLNPSAAIAEIEEERRTLQLRGSTPETDEKLSLVPELLYDNIQLSKSRENIDELRIHVDRLIEKSNHTSYLDIK